MSFANFLAGPIADALSRTLFHFLWEGALIAAALAVAIHVFRPSSASVRYGLACVAMLAMVAAFAATFATTLAWHWPHSTSLTIRSNALPLSMPPPAPFAWPQTTPSGAASGVNWIVPAWLLGAGLFSLRSLIAWIAAMRLKRTGAFPAAEIWRKRLGQLGERIRISRPVMLLESYLTDVPVVVGFLRPAILVPAALFTGFPLDQLEFILIHELAHIRRGDYLVNLLQSVVEDVLFYHPAVWWISSVMRAERENCCDDIVVAETHNAPAFAAALAALEQNRWAAQEAALAVNGGHLMNRVRRLLEGRDRVRLTAVPAFFASLLPVLFVIAASATHAQSVATAPPLPAPPAPRPPVLVAQAPQQTAVQPVAAQPETPYKKRLNEEVVYIISDEDRKAFKSLRTDEERQQFIQNWLRAPVLAAQARPGPLPSPQFPQAAQPETPYTKWLNEEAVYIISDEERRAFSQLSDDAARQMFIQQFWLRRDPTPATDENEFREEIYRRIAYANESFRANGIPGWRTDRGMIYIKYGPPDGGVERGGPADTVPSEKWRYRFIEVLGGDVTIDFVDTTGTGEYHMTRVSADCGSGSTDPAYAALACVLRR